jgi:hypothetical protein
MKYWYKIVQEIMISKEIDKDIESKIKNNKLYHVTNIEASVNIMKHNYFRASRGTIGIMGLSTTFDPNYVWGRGEIKFVLDYKKLKRDFKLLFIDEGLNGVDESEIKIISNEAIMPANKYTSNIEYSGTNKQLKEMITNFLKA